MIYQNTASSALAATILLIQVSVSAAGHARAHLHAGHHHRARAVAGSMEVPMTELSMLQSEQTTFSGWMNDWFNSSGSADREAAVALLQQEYEAYQGWMSAWLDSVMSAGTPSPTALPVTAASVPLPVATNSAISTAASTPTLRPVTFASVPLPVATTLTSILVPIKPSAPATPVTSVPPIIAASSVAAPELDHVPSSSSSGTEHSAASPYDPPAISSQVPVQPRPDTSVALQPSTSAVALSAPIQTAASGSSSGSGSSFDAQSHSNVAVYYGQSPATSQVTLAQMCRDSSVDIVVLAFLTTFFGPGGYPQVNFGAACGSITTEAMTSKGASGLFSCPTMAQDITACQNAGKKVLLSLGGSLATSAFSSDSQADEFASMLWNLFGSGTGEDAGLRPFGDVKVDGFDLDNEDHSTAFYSSFVSSLRTTMSADKTRTYYISAAPQCPRPDASIPLDAMQTMDFVFVQFYNNGDCNVGQSGFVDSFKAWSSDLSAKGTGPKLYIGAPGCEACAGAGSYVDPTTMTSVIDSVKDMSNLGGVMLWDGSESLMNVNAGKDYTQVVKSALV